MTDFPKNINRIWIWLLRMLPFLSCVFWHMSTGRSAHSRIGLSICAISSFIYCLGVVFKNKSKAYSISEGALLLVMIQLSIIAYITFDYFDIKTLIVNFRVILVSLLSIILLIAIFKAFVIIPKHSDDICNLVPNVDISELTNESRNILSTLESIDLKKKETLIYGCIYLLKDYIYTINKTRELFHSNRLISHYMPSQYQIVNYPFESLALLLSAQNYIENNYTEDRYCNFQTNLQIIDERLSCYKQ